MIVNQQINIFDQTVMNAHLNFAPDKFWLLNQTHSGWKQKIKSTIVTASVGNSWNKVNNK